MKIIKQNIFWKSSLINLKYFRTKYDQKPQYNTPIKQIIGVKNELKRIWFHRH